MNKKEILEIHKKKFKYWQGKNGNWNTYFPKKDTEPPYGRLVSKVNQERLNQAIIDYYVKENTTLIVPTFKQVYEEWREIKNLELCDNSILRYNSDYNRFFGGSDFENLPVNAINENTIRLYMLKAIKKQNLCPEACKRMFSYIKNTIRYARIEKYVTDNPVEFMELKQFRKHCIPRKKPDAEQIFNNIELAMITKGLNELYVNKPTYIPRYGVELSLLTGMRPGEVASLKWTDIFPDYLKIHTSIKHNRLKNEFYIDTTKNGETRQFPMCDEIRTLLDRIKKVQKEYGLVSEFIFPNEEGGFINGQLISDCMKRLTAYLGIHGGGITALRKTINSNLKQNGVSSVIAASMLGHSPQVNETYYTFDTSDIAEKKKIIKERNSKLMSLEFKP